MSQRARRLHAMLRRYTFLLLRSWPRIVDIIYWPTVQLLMWGFLQTFLAGQSGTLAAIAGVFIGSVLLWDILFRGQIGFSVTFLEEMWSRNIGHLMISPLRPTELAASLMLVSILRVLIGVVPVSVLAIVFFGFNAYDTGLMLIAFFLNLMATSWAIGLLVCGLLVRYGLGVENLAWGFGFILLPLCCVYYPLETLPQWLHPVALALPPTHVFEGMRALLIDDVRDMSLLFTALALNMVYLGLGFWVFLHNLERARESGALLQIGE
ncbi:MAG: ABC transporter permease [Rhizobiales bacterium]|nr:ABC transporter permease [Hyphomicrobiales bacterium]